MMRNMRPPHRRWPQGRAYASARPAAFFAAGDWPITWPALVSVQLPTLGWPI